jgi:hypothetical protein
MEGPSEVSTAASCGGTWRLQQRHQAVVEHGDCSNAIKRCVLVAWYDRLPRLQKCGRKRCVTSSIIRLLAAMQCTTHRGLDVLCPLWQHHACCELLESSNCSSITRAACS